MLEHNNTSLNSRKLIGKLPKRNKNETNLKQRMLYPWTADTIKQDTLPRNFFTEKQLSLRHVDLDRQLCPRMQCQKHRKLENQDKWTKIQISCGFFILCGISWNLCMTRHLDINAA